MKTLPEHNLEKLAALFPNVITEVQDEDGKLHKAVDFEKLRLILEPDEIAEGREYYSFTWAGKRNAVTEAGRPTYKVLRPCIEESKDFETTQNLYIEGENLEVLKIIQTAYMNKIKMIYIDPPYNTGHDLIYYNDDYSYSIQEDKLQFQFINDDDEKNFSLDNYRESAKSNPRFHSNWCSMIYPRLMIAKNLLSDDGVIFISIDDNEQANLRKICDEIFGEDNFVAQLVWQKKYGPANDSTGISQTHEYISVYAKNIINWRPGLLERNEEQLSAYHNPDNDPRGAWRASDLSARTYSASCDYPITGPTGLVFNPPRGRSWIVNEKRYHELLRDNRITFGTDNKSRPMQKKFLTEVKQGITPETWTPREKVGDNKEARYELKSIFPENIYDTLKPTRLLIHLMTLANLEDDDIVFDFFSGSATTAHAVMKLNSEDGGHRKFIMVQIQESCPPQSEAYKAGYRTTCEIGKERIRRAGENLKGDTGFRVLKLDTSNMRDVYISPKEFTQFVLDDLIENIKPDRTGIDLLFGEAADSGMPLSLPYKSENVSGFTIHIYGDNDIIACFDENINEELIKNIAKRKPQRAVFRDSCFENSSVRINLEQIFKFYAPNADIKVL